MSLAEQCRKVAADAQAKSDEYGKRSYYAADMSHYVVLSHEFGNLALRMQMIADSLESSQTREQEEVTV